MKAFNTSPGIAIKTGTLLIPFSFATRTLESALTDLDYLRDRIPFPNLRDAAIAAVASVGDNDWERICRYADALGIQYGNSDFGSMGFLFREIGGICDSVPQEGDPSYMQDFYTPEEGRNVIVTGNDGGYFWKSRRALGGEQSLEEFRAKILVLFNTSRMLARKCLYEQLSIDLGVNVEIEETDGSLVARQIVPDNPDPFYALVNFESDSTGSIRAGFVRYRLSPEYRDAMQILHGHSPCSSP